MTTRSATRRAASENYYRCHACGRVFGTVLRERGATLTPRCGQFTVVGCGAPMDDCVTRPPGAADPTHEWYRPEPPEFRAMASDPTQAALVHHVQRGGLLLRPIPQSHAGDPR